MRSATGFLAGTPDAVAEDLRQWAQLGIVRVMLQIVDMTDLDAIDLLATKVLPAFR